MTTKKEIIEIIKTENPTLRIGDDQSGYTDLSAAEYEATVAEWAKNRSTKLDKIAEAEAKATAKAALLSKLGITAEEARLLLP